MRRARHQRRQECRSRAPSALVSGVRRAFAPEESVQAERDPCRTLSSARDNRQSRFGCGFSEGVCPPRHRRDHMRHATREVVRRDRIRACRRCRSKPDSPRESTRMAAEGGASRITARCGDIAATRRGIGWETVSQDGRCRRTPGDALACPGAPRLPLQWRPCRCCIAGLRRVRFRDGSSRWRAAEKSLRVPATPPQRIRGFERLDEQVCSTGVAGSDCGPPGPPGSGRSTWNTLGLRLFHVKQC